MRLMYSTLYSEKARNFIRKMKKNLDLWGFSELGGLRCPRIDVRRAGESAQTCWYRIMCAPFDVFPHTMKRGGSNTITDLPHLVRWWCRSDRLRK